MRRMLEIVVPALAVALSAAHSQALPDDLAPCAELALAFLAQPGVASDQGRLRSGSRPDGIAPSVPTLLVQPWPVVPTRGYYQGGYLAFDKATARVIQFRANRPLPPVPYTLLPRDQAREPALAFARRNAPELFAPGGEVTVEPEPAITRDGAWLFRLQRVERGVNMPVRAEVGIRVYDGKVVWYRFEQQTVKVSLDGLQSREQARAVAEQTLEARRQKLDLWLDERLEAADFAERPGQARVAWRLQAEVVQPKAQFPNLAGYVHRWLIDAHSGEVLRHDASKVLPDRYRWYVAHGGKHTVEYRPTPELVSRDSGARLSPDGTRLVFSSNRPRPGYPAWLERPYGLFLAELAGEQPAKLRCLEPGEAFRPEWSEDGTRIAFLQAGDLVVLDPASGQRQKLAHAPGQRGYRRAGWYGRKLAAVLNKDDFSRALVLVDPDHPEAQPVPLPAPFKADPSPSYHLLCALPGGRLYYTTDPPPDTKSYLRDVNTLWCQDLAHPETPPQKVAERLPFAKELVPAPGGKLLLTLRDRAEWLLVNLADGTNQPWSTGRRGAIEMPGWPPKRINSEVQVEEVGFGALVGVAALGEQVAYGVEVPALGRVVERRCSAEPSQHEDRDQSHQGAARQVTSARRRD